MKPAGLISAGRWGALALTLSTALQVGCASHSASTARAKEKAAPPAPKAGFFEGREIAQEAYVYGFPMIANYKSMYQFTIDPESGQYKAPFNKLWNDTEVFTPKDAAVVTPNADTPYSLLEMDLRAEPLVLSVPEVPSGRYYCVQLVDLYTCTYGYLGSRTTGNGASAYLVAGPNWRGETPAGIKKAFRCETQFGLAIYRTQLLNPGDIENVKKVQAGYKVQTLSAYLKKPAPPSPTATIWKKFSAESFRTESFATLNFLLQFCPAVPEETALRARFAEIGVAPGRPFDFNKLSLEHKLALGMGIKDGYDDIEKARTDMGEVENGWRLATAFGDRAFYKGDWLLRAAAAMSGIYGNVEAEAVYPIAYNDSTGHRLDASRNKYTLTFPEGKLPPVKAFWSVTMYDRQSQLLVTNSINRYLINSPMLPDLKKNADGSLTLHIQQESPGPEKQSNWLPAPSGDFYLVMRLYWPKETALNGDWKPPGVERSK